MATNLKNNYCNEDVNHACIYKLLVSGNKASADYTINVEEIADKLTEELSNSWSKMYLWLQKVQCCNGTMVLFYV
jgi:hypothetical protein